MRLFSAAYVSAREIVENWRASHAYPMLIMRNNLSNRVRKIDNKAIVAQRLKRFTSIVSKLEREPDMKLSQMQDIGGCRAIVSTVEQVDDLVRIHEEMWAKQSSLFGL